MEDKIKEILKNFWKTTFSDKESCEHYIPIFAEKLKKLYQRNVPLEYDDNKTCGDIAKEMKFPVGKIGCPHCGVGHIGKLHKVCAWCGADIFSDISMPVLSVIERIVKDKPKYWRKGQAWFNIAYTLYPAEVDMIRGSENDCFYKDSRIKKFKECLFELLTN